MSRHEGSRVGSSFEVHAWSSFWLGAASAYEFEDVKRVNVNFFWITRTMNVYPRRRIDGAYPKEHLHLRIALDVHARQADHADLLDLVRVRVHVQVRPEGSHRRL